ncbi:hypothetical protein Tco_0674206 [Tanacetum coccineum]
MFFDIACEEYVQEVLEILKVASNSTSDLMIDSRSPSFTPFGGSDFLMEEIDEFLEHDDSIPPGVDGIYDSEGDMLLRNSSIRLQSSRLSTKQLSIVLQSAAGLLSNINGFYEPLPKRLLNGCKITRSINPTCWWNMPYNSLVQPDIDDIDHVIQRCAVSPTESRSSEMFLSKSVFGWILQFPTFFLLLLQYILLEPFCNSSSCRVELAVEALFLVLDDIGLKGPASSTNIKVLGVTALCLSSTVNPLKGQFFSIPLFTSDSIPFLLK